MRASYVSLLASVLHLHGCAGPNQFVGTWDAQLSVFQQSGKLVQKMNPDGTFESEITVSAMGQEVKALSSGRWESRDPQSLTLVQESVRLEGVPEALESEVRKQLGVSSGKPISVTTTWTGTNEFSASGIQGLGPITFKRRR